MCVILTCLSWCNAEGVTHLDPKGDGVHFISNGKDQCVKLWDMRRTHSPNAARRLSQDPAVPSYNWCAAQNCALDYCWVKSPALPYHMLLHFKCYPT